MTSALTNLLVPLDKKLRASDEFLKAKHNLLAQFDSVDDLITDEAKASGMSREVEAGMRTVAGMAARGTVT
jgi:hypothetical protein